MILDETPEYLEAKRNFLEAKARYWAEQRHYMSELNYWELKFSRDDSEEMLSQNDDPYSQAQQREWIALADAEIARREEQFKLRGRSPPDGYDIHYSPMWMEGCNSHCIYVSRHHPWVETAGEQLSRKGFEAWWERKYGRPPWP